MSYHNVKPPALRRSERRERAPRLALIGLLSCALTLLLPAEAAANDEYIFARQPKKLALVIGNGNYKHLGPIGSAPIDGATMEKRLEAVGFDVDYFPDVPTLARFQSEILRDFRRKIDEGDFVVFYFSGHGFSYGQNNYLAPTDMPASIPEADVTRHAISVDALEGRVASHSPGLIMFFIDACRTVGGPVVNNKQDENVASKGSAPQRNNNLGTNSAIFYATRPGQIADGFDDPGRMSRFTQAVADHIDTKGRPFSAVFKLIAAHVRLASNEGQIPGDFNWSQTDPYFNPTEQNLEEEKEAWRSVLETRDAQQVKLFSYLYSVSHYSAACRKWLNDELNREHAARFTRASPVAIDRAWRPESTARLSVRRLSIPLAFTRSLEEHGGEFLRRLSDAQVGLVASGTSPQAGDPLKFSVESVDAHEVAVATTALRGLANPSASSAVVERIPSGTQLKINGVVEKAGGNTFVSATTLADTVRFFIKIPRPAETPELLELGESIKQIVVGARPDSLPGLVDPAPIEEAVAQLKAQGWDITWVSLSTAPTDNQPEQDVRSVRLANAEFILKRTGIDGTRITSVSGREDFSGDGVRIRFFGTR